MAARSVEAAAQSQAFLRAHDGRLFFYDRQELQHSPGNPAETTATNQLINTIDSLDSNQPQIQKLTCRPPTIRCD